MITPEIALAILALLGVVANIVYTHTRTRGTVDTLKAEAEADEIKRRSELEDKRLEVWSQMVMALQKTTERLDSMSNAQTQTNQVTTQVSETLVKNTEVLRDQAETLDTATGLLSAVSQSQESYQKQGITAINTIQTVPTLIGGVKADIADAKKVIDGLPASLRDELKPVTDKLASLDKHVEDMAADIKREIGQIRSDVMALVQSVLKPPEPTLIAAIAVAPVEPGATP